MRLYREFYGLLWFIGFVLGFMLYLFAPLIVNLLYGSSYNESVSALRIYSICLPFAYVLIGSGRWYIDNNQELLAFWRTLAALLINVLGNLVLIPFLGIDGAAFATVGSYIFALGAMWFNQRTRSNLVLVVHSLIPVRFYNSARSL
jgi:O-antigen/teichoic acid export membrane protein